MTRWRISEYSLIAFKCRQLLEPLFSVNPETFESRLASHVKVLARKITARDELDQLERFVARKGSVLAGNSIAIGQALELARINIQWVENQLGGFVAYLRLLERSGFDASRMEWF